MSQSLLNLSAGSTRTCTAKWRLRLLLLQSDPPPPHCHFKSDEKCSERRPLLGFCSGRRDWRLNSKHQKSAFLNLCCLLHWNLLLYFCVKQLDLQHFPHMLSEMFLIPFTSCRCIMSNLVYWCSLVTVVSTLYLRHSCYEWLMHALLYYI